MQTDGTVLIVGAGICGLACALALAKQARRVRVLEARLDPRSERGCHAFAVAERETLHANDALARGDLHAANEHFSFADLSRTSVWGSRNRNILFDSHSLGFLRSLGVRVDDLPPLRSFDTHLGAELPSLHIRYGPRETVTVAARLDAPTLMAQRDPVAVAALADVEFALREAVESEPLTELHYDSPVVACSETSDAIEVSCAGAEPATITGQLLVVADGAGNRSLSRRLSLARAERGAATVDIAVFRCDPADKVLGHRLSDAWLDAQALPDGWVVFLSSGKGLLTVNLRRIGGSSGLAALDIARRAGVRGTLLEPQASVRYSLDRAQRFVHGARTVVVGDAACRASPAWAFGAQFALLWAQMIADLYVAGPQHGVDQSALARFAEEAERVADSRLEFERSALELVDSTNADIRGTSPGATSGNLLAAIDDFEIAFEALGPHGGPLRIRLGIDMEDLPGARDSPQLSAFWSSVGRFDIEGILDLRFERGRAESNPTPSAPIDYRTNLETIRLTGGTLSAGRTAGQGWTVAIDDADLNRTVRSSGAAVVASIESAELRLPDAFVTRLFQGLGPQLWAFGAARDQPLCFEIEFQPGSFEIGTFSLNLRGDPLARVTLRRTDRGAKVSFELVRGTATAEKFSAFVRRTPLAAIGPLRLWQTMLGRLADPLLDLWASSASLLVRRVDFDMHADGTGNATYDAWGVPINLPLTREDVQLLIGKLFNSSSCERIVQQYQRRVTAARMMPRRPGAHYARH